MSDVAPSLRCARFPTYRRRANVEIFDASSKDLGAKLHSPLQVNEICGAQILWCRQARSEPAMCVAPINAPR